MTLDSFPFMDRLEAVCRFCRGGLGLGQRKYSHSVRRGPAHVSAKHHVATVRKQSGCKPAWPRLRLGLLDLKEGEAEDQPQNNCPDHR